VNVAAALAQALGVEPLRIGPLAGGCVGEVYRVELAGGRTLVAKVDRWPQPVLEREAFMLRYLAEHTRLPAPGVVHSAARLLVIEFLPGQSHFTPAAEVHAAELLAELHGLSAAAYGLDQDTLIGGLHQPNPWTDSWAAFFRQHRLLYMGAEAMKAGRLPATTLGRLERLAGRIERWIEEPEPPALIHGDVWTTNVLAQGDRITGFLDPAIYYADREMELAFITLFGSFGQAFFDRYQALRPIRPGFWEARRELYNLYPLLVHVRLFGGGYVAAVERTLRRFGC
jgi:fructosamine-3-kinase